MANDNDTFLVTVDNFDISKIKITAIHTTKFADKSYMITSDVTYDDKPYRRLKRNCEYTLYKNGLTDSTDLQGDAQMSKVQMEEFKSRFCSGKTLMNVDIVAFVVNAMEMLNHKYEFGESMILDKISVMYRFTQKYNEYDDVVSTKMFWMDEYIGSPSPNIIKQFKNGLLNPFVLPIKNAPEYALGAMFNCFDDDKICPICKVCITVKSELFVTECFHMYHIQCMIRAYKHKQKCSVCMKQL